MKARLIAVGTRAPLWVKQGFAEYGKRLSHWLPLELIEIELGQRSKGRDLQRALNDEAQRVLAALPGKSHAVALDLSGKAWDSIQLAQRVQQWRDQGQDLTLLIGGPDGHAPAVLQRANERWSLGPLTLPHQLVRLIVAEQLYRACTLIAGHPYHRQ